MQSSVNVDSLVVQEHVSGLAIQTTVQKWGNSLALRLAKSITSQLGINEHSKVEIILENNQLIIRPVTEQPVDIDALIAAITPENLHAEISTGEAVGREIW